MPPSDEQDDATVLDSRPTDKNLRPTPTGEVSLGGERTSVDPTAVNPSPPAIDSVPSGLTSAPTAINPQPQTASAPAETIRERPSPLSKSKSFPVQNRLAPKPAPEPVRQPAREPRPPPDPRAAPDPRASKTGGRKGILRTFTDENSVVGRLRAAAVRAKSRRAIREREPSQVGSPIGTTQWALWALVAVVLLLLLFQVGRFVFSALEGHAEENNTNVTHIKRTVSEW